MKKKPRWARLCENWGESDREGRIDNDAAFSMSYIRGEDREQASFLPARIDDYVGAEAAVRVIDAFAERLDVVGLGFVRAVPAATGRPGYDPRDLLKLYVYGYLNEVRSSRKLERECGCNVELMWNMPRPPIASPRNNATPSPSHSPANETRGTSRRSSTTR